MFFGAATRESFVMTRQKESIHRHRRPKFSRGQSKNKKPRTWGQFCMTTFFERRNDPNTILCDLKLYQGMTPYTFLCDLIIQVKEPCTFFCDLTFLIENHPNTILCGLNLQRLAVYRLSWIWPNLFPVFIRVIKNIRINTMWYVWIVTAEGSFSFSPHLRIFIVRFFVQIVQLGSFSVLPLLNSILKTRFKVVVMRGEQIVISEKICSSYFTA